jgi:hypothetical protein
MIFKKKSSELATAAQTRFLDETRSHLGYRPRPGGISEFALRTGYKGETIPWSGSFIDCVARDAGVVIPSCVYSSSGLSEFVLSRRAHTDPRPGDIVFYNFPTGAQFGMPHVGIVMACDEYMQTGAFLAIEANVNPGLPKGHADRDGIYERVRYKDDVIMFGRPDFDFRQGVEHKMQTGHLFIKEHNVRPGRQNPDVQTVQLALSTIVTLDDSIVWSKFDSTTQRAYSRWQRLIGYVYPDSTGIPDLASLKLLGERSGIFEVKPPED